MALRYPTRGSEGVVSVIRRDNSPLKYLSLDKLRLESGQQHENDLLCEEALIVVLGGKCSVRLNGCGLSGTQASPALQWEHLGTRGDPFGGNPTAAYISPGWSYRIRAEGPVQALVVRSPWHVPGAGLEEVAARQAEDETPPREPLLIEPKDVRVVSVGTGNWRRDVRFILSPDSPSRRLIAAETLNPPGNWSGFPPHKHDCASDGEAVLEELYHFSVQPADSFGIQRIYGSEGSVDEALVVHDGDVVVFPNGYHPTVAPPGTSLCYFWAVAGPSKALRVSIDARYAWLGLAEGVIREMQRCQAAM